MNIRFVCPQCECPGRTDWPSQSSWQCPQCEHDVEIKGDAAPDHVATCAICGSHELYKKKDFPHSLGMTILVVACLAFMVAQAFYWKWTAWAILVGSALFDGVLYLTVRDAVVCYRCGASYRGLAPHSAYEPFDLGIAERHRQERIRREQLHAEKK